MEQNVFNWYAVYTKPRWEKKVANGLTEHGVENYCPLNKVVRQWSDRKKIVMEPVFKGYVFVRPKEELKWEVVKNPGVLNYVYWLGKPARIKNKEIIVIKKFLNEFENVEVSASGLVANATVRITRGVLMNYEGMVVEVFGNKAIVNIQSLDIQLSAHFDKKNLELVK